MDEFFIALHMMGLKADGGISGLARRLGVREQVLINKLNPHDFNSEPKIGEFVAMLHDTGNLEPLEVLCMMLGGRFVTRASGRSESVMGALLHSISEHGDIARVGEAALSDGRITADERVSLLREIGEARDALTRLENTLIATSTARA